MKKLFLIWMCGSGIFAFGQEINKEFTKLLLNEQFNQAEKTWSSTFNADNLFIAQNGFYELYRKSKKSGYYLFSNSNEEYTAFQLETSVVFNDHGNRKQSAGLVMMAQSETSGGILVEINQKREYRVMKIAKDKQTPLIGSGNGWFKAPAAITKVENTIVIKTYDKVYDIYINGQYLNSFTDIELNKGKIGIFVGPDSKVKFDYLKILGEDKKDLNTLNSTDAKSIEESFTQIIVKLKDQINRKDKELDEYKTKLKLCESGGGGMKNSDTALIGLKNRLSDRVESLEIENEDLKTQLANMEDELVKLKEFKQRIEQGNEEGDIIINLTNMVSSQKTKIEELERKNKSLNDESNSLFIETKDLTKQLDKSTNELSVSKTENKELKTELDSLRKLVLSLKDSLARKSSDTSLKSGNGTKVKELSEDEILQQMIEKEREERRKRKEEEERLRKEEEEKNKQDQGNE